MKTIDLANNWFIYRLTHIFPFTLSDEDGVSRFTMQFLGSVEVNEHKGDDVLCQAINKVHTQYKYIITFD